MIADQTIVTLADGIAYETPFRDIPDRYEGLSVLLTSSTSGILTAIWSVDGRFNDYTEITKVRGGVPVSLFLPKRARYVRVQFLNNSGSLQSYFRFQSIFCTTDTNVNNRSVNIALWESESTGAGGVSASGDLRYCTTASVYGHVDGACTLAVQYSPDDANWYDIGTSWTATGAEDVQFSFDNIGARYVRVVCDTDVTATLWLGAKH